MARLVTYSLAGRKNPADKQSETKYYAQAQARCVTGVDEMADRIQRSCTVTRADIMAVLVALSETVAESLQNGEIVRLGNLGSFQIGLSGKGAPSKEEYHTGLIQRVRINFRPGSDLAGALEGLAYERVETKEKKKADDGEETTTD